MSGDYGVRGRMRLTAGQRIALTAAGLLTLAVSAWLYGGAYLRQRESALALNQDARIDGPPCPQLSAAAFRTAGLKVAKGVFYEDVRFYRQFGHMSCSALRYGGGWSPAVYPVCQFTAPNTLRVQTDKGDWYFHPGFGVPATIATPHGVARCVLASNFTLQKLRGHADHPR